MGRLFALMLLAALFVYDGTQMNADEH